MIDNLEDIIPLLKFESEDDFYYLQILQRKKENPYIGSNSIVIKNYFISSKESLLKMYPEIKTLCNQFNARASIRLNKRSYESVAFKTLANIANSMQNKEYKFIKNSYSRACGLSHNDKVKKWIIDIDEEVSFDYLYNMNELIIELGGEVLVKLRSKSGYHLITTPFRLDKFKDIYKDIDIHKDNPTNLYIP